MAIGGVIREQRGEIEALWWESVRDWPASAALGRERLARQLHEYLDALCRVLEGAAPLPRALIERHVAFGMDNGNRTSQIVWQHVLVERCVYQVWANLHGGWPPEDEARKLRGVLQEAVAIAIERISEDRMGQEHLSVRRALDELEMVARATLDDQPNGTTRGCLAAIRHAFGSSAKVAILIVMDRRGIVVDSIWEGEPARPEIDLAQLARQVSEEREVVQVSADELAFFGLRTLIARSVVLDGLGRGALVVGLDQAASGPARRMLDTVADRLAGVLVIARRHQGTRDEVHHLSDERNLREKFVDALAHDLRGPLTVARLSVDVLKQKLPQPELSECAQRAARCIDRATGMLRDLLDAGRVRAGQPLPLSLAALDLSALVRELVDELRAVHGPRFLVLADSGLRGVWCGRELRRCLWNLIMNALQHGLPGRPVGIEATGDSDGVRLVVRNEGPPISKEVLDRMFEPYRQQHGGGGWGLGLTLVRACAEAHGGNVTVSNDRGFTTFVLRLPFDSRPYYEALLRRSEEAVAGPGL